MAVTYQDTLSSTMMGDYPCICAKCQDDYPDDCEVKCRLQSHCENITYLMAECPKIVKILVSPGKIEMTCHKAALGFHSDFFDAAFYGGMAETTEGVIRLPEESKEGISTFISWVYSGQIRSSVCAEELWVLGDKLRSPKFCNEVMCFIIGMYGNSSKDRGRWLSARSMDFIYEKATETSSLMLFARHLLRAGGPLCPRAIRDETKFTKDGAYEKDWRELIKRGGDLVLLIAFETSFFQDGLCEFLDDKEAPWTLANHKKYMLPTTSTTAKVYLMEKALPAIATGRRR